MNGLIAHYKKNKLFYLQMLSLAIPMTIQNIITSSLQLVDNVMIGQLGSAEIAAVGFANRYFFLFTLLIFGLASGGGIFLSQFWGIKDLKSIRKTTGLTLVIGLAIGFSFFFGAAFFPELIMRFFTNDIVVIKHGSEYLRLVSPTYIFVAVTFIYAVTLRTTNQAKIPMYVSGLAILINTGLNLLLIFGNLGFPRLEVRGAAIATTIARAIETALMIGIIYKLKLAPAGKLKELLGFDFSYFKRYSRKIVPVLINEGVWAFGVVMHSFVYGRMGTEAAAAVSIASVIENLAIVLFFGIGNACAIMLGGMIARDEFDNAYESAKRFRRIATIMGIIIGIVLISVARPLVSIYNVNDAIKNNAYLILVLFGILMVAKMNNYLYIIGIFRSGGDTTYCLLVDILGMWGIAVPLAFITGLWLKLPIYVVFGAIMSEEIVKLFFVIKRFKSKKWINNLVKKEATSLDQSVAE